MDFSSQGSPLLPQLWSKQHSSTMYKSEQLHQCLCLLQSFRPSSAMTPELNTRTCDINILFSVECSLYLPWPVVGILILMCYKKKLLWWELRDVPIHEYTNNSLGISLILGPFSRMIVVGSSLEPMTCLATRYRPTNSGFHLVEWAFNAIKKWLVIPITSVPQLHWWACLVRPVIVDAQCLQLGKTDDDFFLWLHA